jgi:hypothetical protein
MECNARHFVNFKLKVPTEDYRNLALPWRRPSPVCPGCIEALHARREGLGGRHLSLRRSRVGEAYVASPIIGGLRDHPGSLRCRFGCWEGGLSQITGPGRELIQGESNDEPDEYRVE